MLIADSAAVDRIFFNRPVARMDDGAVRRLFAAHVPHFDLDEPSTPAAIAFSHGWSPFTWSVRPLDHDPIPRENLSGGAALMKHDS